MESAKEDVRGDYEDFLQNELNGELIQSLGFDGLSKEAANDLAQYYIRHKAGGTGFLSSVTMAGGIFFDELDRLIKDYREC